MARISWPFKKMKVGQTVTITHDVHKARTAAHVTGATKGWKFRTRLDLTPDQKEVLVVTRLARDVSPLELKWSDDPKVAAANADVQEEGHIPDCMRHGGVMPDRYTGRYPFEHLKVGESIAFTAADASQVGLGRIYSAACNAGGRKGSTRKYSVSRGIDPSTYQFAWVVVRRVS